MCYTIFCNYNYIVNYNYIYLGRDIWPLVSEDGTGIVLKCYFLLNLHQYNG